MSKAIDAIKTKLAKLEAQKKELELQAKEAERAARDEVGRLIISNPQYLTTEGWEAVSEIYELGERYAALATKPSKAKTSKIAVEQAQKSADLETLEVETANSNQSTADIFKF
jgi:hypothetical protein